MGKGKEQELAPMVVTDLDAIKDNTREAVDAFAQRYISMPGFGLDVEVMNQAQLRDAMGLRATFEYGDPWPAAEKLLIQQYHFRWHMLGGQRVMFLKEREDFVPDTGWEDGNELIIDN